MIVETLAPGSFKVTEGRAVLFVGTCAEGCRWMLSPRYLEGGWIARHGQNDEAVLVFERKDLPDPLDPVALLAAIEDWVERVHEYEGAAS